MLKNYTYLVLNHPKKFEKLIILRYQYIRDMIEAFIAGSTLHLNINEIEVINILNKYKKYKIWGIKALIIALIRDIFNIFYLNLPDKQDHFRPETDLLDPLKLLAQRYKISFKMIQDFIEERKSSRMIWNSLDRDQKALFYVNAFFEAFEKNIIDA